MAEDQRAGTGFANERETQDRIAATEFSNELNAKRKTDQAARSDFAKEREAEQKRAGKREAEKKKRSGTDFANEREAQDMAAGPRGLVEASGGIPKHLGAVLGPCWSCAVPGWSHLGRSWSQPGRSLRATWERSWPSWGHLGGVLGRRGASLQESQRVEARLAPKTPSPKRARSIAHCFLRRF